MKSFVRAVLVITSLFAGAECARADSLVTYDLQNVTIVNSGDTLVGTGSGTVTIDLTNFLNVVSILFTAVIPSEDPSTVVFDSSYAKSYFAAGSSGGEFGASLYDSGGNDIYLRLGMEEPDPYTGSYAGGALCAANCPAPSLVMYEVHCGEILYVNSGTLGPVDASVTPEPASWILLATGLLLVLYQAFRRKTFLRVSAEQTSY